MTPTAATASGWPHRPTWLRWSLWIVLGMLAGVAVGFALGLARPQVER